MFEEVSSYNFKLLEAFRVEFPENDTGHILDPCLLYLSGEKDVTSIFSKYPYLGDMANTFELYSDEDSDGDSYIELIGLNLESKLMSELELEFKNLNTIEFLQAVISKHNSKHVTLSPVYLQKEDKEKCLSM